MSGEPEKKVEAKEELPPVDVSPSGMRMSKDQAGWVSGATVDKTLRTITLAAKVINAWPTSGLKLAFDMPVPYTADPVKRLTLEQEKTELVKELQSSNIDPVLFDSLLSNEINRRLKVQFGVAFLAMTAIFTAASYGIVVCNGIFKWNVSDAAITGLIIETPIQFVGLLYIIARNLFPSQDTSLKLPPAVIPVAVKPNKEETA